MLLNLSSDRGQCLICSQKRGLETVETIQSGKAAEKQTRQEREAFQWKLINLTAAEALQRAEKDANNRIYKMLYPQYQLPTLPQN